MFAVRWAAVLGGITLAATVVCAYGLATKVFPSGLPANAPARLQEPFGYWNALGLTAAMGVIGCMWLGARRRGHALLSAMAYPACGLLLLTLLLAYSRGALAALAVGAVLWLAIVPLRLRGAAVLLAGMLGAGAVAGWDFSQHALSDENIPLAQRAAAGHELGALALVMVLALALAGMALTFFTSRRAPAPRTRRRAGIALWALVGLAVLALIGGLAHSHRGLTGSVSHAVSALTNPNAKPPPNTPGRLTAVASVRARYWKEALQVFGAHPALGAGAEGYATARLRYRKETLVVTHAHGFVVQTLADLGIVGLLVALALLGSWIFEARRPTRPLNRPPRPYTPERVGLLSMLCIVVVFGVHSLIDWTWYVPGDACVALLCAGWLAGTGAARARRRARRPRPQSPRWRLPEAGSSIRACCSPAWSWRPRCWSPGRSGSRSDPKKPAQQALTLAEAGTAARVGGSGPHGGLEGPGVRRSALRPGGGAGGGRALRARPRDAAARRCACSRRTRRRGSNWRAIDLRERPRAALKEFQAAVYLNPESIAPEEISGPAAQPESIEIYDRLVELIRRTGQRVAGAGPRWLRSARVPPRPAARAGSAAGRGRAPATRSKRKSARSARSERRV